MMSISREGIMDKYGRVVQAGIRTASFGETSRCGLEARKAIRPSWRFQASFALAGNRLSCYAACAACKPCARATKQRMTLPRALRRGGAFPSTGKRLRKNGFCRPAPKRIIPGRMNRRRRCRSPPVQPGRRNPLHTLFPKRLRCRFPGRLRNHPRLQRNRISTPELVSPSAHRGGGAGVPATPPPAMWMNPALGRPSAARPKRG